MSSTRKVRYKKLSAKTALPVLREDQIDPAEYEPLTHETQIATGVDQAEENEFHLQSALKGPGASTDKEIPVPPPQVSSLDYDKLYSASYEKTASYIRFSQTVEDCGGCQYDATEEDETFLKKYNESRAANAQLSLDDFEKLMHVYEDTAKEITPFGSIDQTIAKYDDMIVGLRELEEPAKLMTFAKDIYEYWKSRRQESGNQPLHPALKAEMHQEQDDLDPYVCFRRREVRQTRKTRARDVQSAEKLKKLRQELEQGRQLIQLTHEREVRKLEMLLTDRMIYDYRAQLKETKVRLGIKTDDDDLYNLKERKRKAVEPPPTVQRPPHTQLRLAVRPDSRTVEPDLVQLSDRLAEKENELRADVEGKIRNHEMWNKNHIDLTRHPLPPVKDHKVEVSFRPAKTQYLMTPPTSVSGESAEEPTLMELDEPEAMPVAKFMGVRQDDSAEKPPSFRRRVGRLNRLWIDRRGLASPARDTTFHDRWKYDGDSSDNEADLCEVDPYDLNALRFRSSIPLPAYLMPHARKPIMVAEGPPGTARQAIAPPPASLAAGKAQGQTPAKQASASAQTHAQTKVQASTPGLQAQTQAQSNIQSPALGSAKPQPQVHPQFQAQQAQLQQAS